jgi:hypothetical protein
MKNLVWMLPLFLFLILSTYPTILAQNNKNNSTGNGARSHNINGSSSNNSGGMSAKSVEIAKSNTKNLLVNSTGNGAQSHNINGSSNSS